MKKYISYILMLPVLLLSFSCNKEKEPVATMTGIYYAGVDGAEDVIEVSPGKSKTILVRAYADEGKVSDLPVNISFKADPEAVAAYNAAKGTSYVMCPGSCFEFATPEVLMPRYGRASSSAKVRVTGSGMEEGITYLLPLTIDKVTGTDKWELTEAPHAYIMLKRSYVAPDAGKGTKEEPYNLYTAADLLGMTEQLVEKKMIYFRLQADIDMSGVENWIPLNFASPYDYQIDFDGNGHTIDHFTCTFASYPSFFGVLYGNCHDVTFTNAVVESTVGGATGIVGSYCGTSGHPGEAHRVHVQGRVYSPGGNKNGTGALFGRICEATLTACSADAEIESDEDYVGGIFGYDSGVSSVSDCWTTGSVKAKSKVGGIGGGLIKAGSTLTNCYSTMSVSGSFQIAGILGHANLDSSKSNPAEQTNATNEPNNHIERCLAWNPSVSSYMTDTDEHYSSGVIVGYTATKNYLGDCYHKADFVFNECPGNAALGYVVTEQANASPASPLVHGTNNYDFAYHGKTAAASATLSGMARMLGWSDKVWDLSGDVPLIRAKSTDPETGIGGQLPDFPENEFYK